MRFLPWIPVGVFALFGVVAANSASAAEPIRLPTPQYDRGVAVEKAMASRRTYRSFKGVQLTMDQVSQFLWAANGNRPNSNRKVIPSAGALYPLEIYLVAGEGKVKGLSAGVYRYEPSDNTLEMTVKGDKRQSVGQAALSQMWLADAPAIIVIAAIYERTTQKYGERGIRYVHNEAGSADQNLFLQAVSLGLEAGTIGAFEDDDVARAVSLPSETKPLLLVGIGK